MIKELEILFKENKKIKIETEKCTLINLDFVHQRYLLTLDINENTGSYQSVVTILYDDYGFSFKPIEVTENTPMYYEIEGVLVISKESSFSLDNIDSYINKNNNIKSQATYNEAIKVTNGIENSPTILNVPFDCRTFEIGFRKSPIEETQHYDLYDYIVPHNNWKPASDEEIELKIIKYRFLLGRGMGVNHKIERRLEEGVLPILNASVYDDSLEYKTTSFSTVLNKKLGTNEGTDYMLADNASAAVTFSDKQKERLSTLKFDVDKQPVFLMRIEIINHSIYPKMSFIRLPHINTFIMSETEMVKDQFFDNEKGIGCVKNKFYSICRLNGESDKLAIENAILVDKKVTIDILLLHNPLDLKKLNKYYNFDFDKEYKRVKNYYKGLIKNISVINTPEKRLNELWKANYIQLRQNCFGETLSNDLAPCVGVYTPIGSESEGLVNSLAMFGDFDVAKKCAHYFMTKEREDGFIQNMDGYMLENGGALMIITEIFLYTRDYEWLKSIEDKIVKAAEYLTRWIDKNKDEGVRGYGMILGRVADPKDDKKIYMLNANCYKGLTGASLLLKYLDNPKSKELYDIKEELKVNINNSLKENMIHSPLSPLENGTYAPLVCSWADDFGATCLHLNGEICTTHATHIAKDSMLSVPYLLRYNVVDLDSKFAKVIFETQKSLMLTHNTAFSQPYYNAMPFANIRKGNIDDFIEEFYYGLASLSDKDTYYFWEHLFLATPHKTSEQGLFQLRFKELFAYEDINNNVLNVFKAIPKCWMDAKNNHIEIKNMNTYLGKISVSLSMIDKKVYKYVIDFRPFDKNTKIKLYLPTKTNERNADNHYVLLDRSAKEYIYKTI